jgi:hypothetical protein
MAAREYENNAINTRIMLKEVEDRAFAFLSIEDLYFFYSI